MEQIIKFYGKGLIEGIALAALIMMFMAGIGLEEGKLAFIGENLEKENINYFQYNDFKGTYQMECNKTGPKIFFVGNHLQSGTCIIPETIKEKDFAGTELQINVISIKDAGGIELINEYEQETGEIVLKSGIYTVEVCAVDENNKSAKCKIQIPVSK